MAKVTDTVAELARPYVEQAGCTLWDVEYIKEAGEWFLRVYLDKEGGVSIDDCEAVSRPLSDALDEADPIAGRCPLPAWTGLCAARSTLPSAWGSR